MQKNYFDLIVHIFSLNVDCSQILRAVPDRALPPHLCRSVQVVASVPHPCLRAGPVQQIKDGATGAQTAHWTGCTPQQGQVVHAYGSKTQEVGQEEVAKAEVSLGYMRPLLRLNCSREQMPSDCLQFYPDYFRFKAAQGSSLISPWCKI